MSLHGQYRSDITLILTDAFVKRIVGATEKETGMIMMQRKPWLIATLAIMLAFGIGLLISQQL